MRLLVAAMALVALTACGAKPMLDTQAVEEGIREQAQKNGISVDVSCPSDIEIEPGRTFHCLVTHTTDDQTARATVTIEDKSGYVTWDISG